MTHRLLFSSTLFVMLACPSDGDGEFADGTTAAGSSGPESASASASTSSSASTSTSADDGSEGSDGSDGSSRDATVADTSAGNDSSDSSGGETSSGGDADVEVRNTPENCVMGEVVSPYLPDEAGHLAATTLTPPSYPFEVAQVAYDLLGTAAPVPCDSTLAHRVEIYAVEGTEPPAEPADAVSSLTILVEADATATEQRAVAIDLEEPITLTEGQSLVLAVQMAPNDDVSASVCVRACRDTGGMPDLDWWSNSDAAPYPWADMVADFAFVSNFDHRMTGHTP